MKISIDTECSDQLKDTVVKARVSVKVAQMLDASDSLIRDACQMMRQYGLISEDEYEALITQYPTCPTEDEIESIWMKEIARQMYDELEDAIEELRAEGKKPLGVDFINADQYVWTS